MPRTAVPPFVILGRIQVSGVVVVSLAAERFDLSCLPELTRIVDGAREQGARGVVVDVPPRCEVDVAGAVALLVLADGELDVAIAGLSREGMRELGAERRLRAVVLADTWVRAVSELTSRMVTIVPLSSAA